MSLVGAFMKQLAKTVTVMGAVEALSQTSIVNQIIDEASRRTEAAADFLEDLESLLGQVEKDKETK